MKPKKNWDFLCLIMFLLTISACGRSNLQKSKTPIFTNETSLSTTMPAKEIITPSPIKHLDVTSTLITTKIAGTRTSNPQRATNTPTLIPKPTLSQHEKEEIIEGFLTKDYLCDLPCFAGITPGLSQLMDVKNFFDRLFIDPFPSYFSNTISFELKSGERESFINLFISQKIVEFIMAPRYDYPIHQLFNEYGKPDEIYVYIMDTLPVDTKIDYTIYLYYKKGIVAQYSGESNKGSTISICFNPEEKRMENVYFWMWDGSSNESFKNIINNYASKFSPGDTSLVFYRIEDLGNYTIDMIFNTYKDQNNISCIKLKNPYLSP